MRTQPCEMKMKLSVIVEIFFFDLETLSDEISGRYILSLRTFRVFWNKTLHLLTDLKLMCCLSSEIPQCFCPVSGGVPRYKPSRFLVK